MLAAVAVVVPIGDSIAATQSPPLQFRIQEGRVLNAFHQRGDVAAHMLLSDGTQPRVLVAFPAGNSGVGVWFEDSPKPARWTLGAINSLNRRDERGRVLHGIVTDVSVDTSLIVRDAVLGSVRVLRDYQLTHKYPPEVGSAATVADGRVEWTRARLDGAPGYALSIAVVDGEIRRGPKDRLTLSPGATGALRLVITALTGEPPLKPLGNAGVLASASGATRARQALEFLSYEDKFLAGSWRFNTYFGRDTLLSLRLLLPGLQPEAVESGLTSVLQRLDTNGEVAHEEDIGEFAVLRHRKERGVSSDAPIFDYKMIDDDFLLAPLAAAYLLDSSLGRERTASYLAERLPTGERVGAALARNFTWVARAAQSFARAPKPANLIALKPGIPVGQWRDSEDGLAGGRYPYDVNAVLVPAALDAIARLALSGAFDAYATPEQRARLATAETSAQVWARQAPPLFKVRVTSAQARGQIEKYAASVGVSAKAALASLTGGEMIVNAIALDTQFQPIPILHSDGGFALLFQNPSASDVDDIVTGMLRPFPAGLLTDAGVLVANPVLAEASWPRFGATAYHGTVVWSWQQALFAAGLARQGARRDLSAATLQRVREAEQTVWSVIENTQDLRASELWSWRFANGRYEATPFGQARGDADESNAAQLWSTVYLAIPRPKRMP